MPSLNAGSVEDGEIGCRFVQELTVQNSTVFECEMEDVAAGRVGSWIESNDRRGRRDLLERISHASQAPLTTVKAAHAADCLSVGHSGLFQHDTMQSDSRVLSALAGFGEASYSLGEGWRCGPAVAILFLAVLAAQVGGQVVGADPLVGEVGGALQADDRERVVALMHYPLTVTFESVRIPFAGPAALLERFDEVFTPEVRRGLGTALTIEQINGRARVTAITVPRAREDTTAAAASREPRRVAVRGGPRPTRISGSLASGGLDTYLVFVQKGQLLQARLDRGRTEAAVGVVNARTGATVPGAAKGIFAGPVPESAEYRITIRYTGPADAPPLPYLLSISIR